MDQREAAACRDIENALREAGISTRGDLERKSGLTVTTPEGTKVALTLVKEPVMTCRGCGRVKRTRPHVCPE